MQIIMLTIFVILLISSGILIRNRLTLESIKVGDFDIKSEDPNAFPLISVCIPARNEERNIERCVSSFLHQNYPNYEILVLNDGSTDKTAEILWKLENKSNRIRIINGLPKPDDWFGKSWACHQLSEDAAGSYLVFVDADTWVQPNVINDTLARFRDYKLDFLTVWPQQILKTFWEKVVIPMIYYVLLCFLISDYVTQFPRWIPPFLHKRLAPLFSAADGQFIAFTKEAYRKIDGHKSVKNEIVEDVSLSRLIRKAGLKMRMFHGVDSVYCRMYHTHHEIFEGFRKNFLAGFNKRIFLFLLAGVFHFILFVLPIFLLIPGIFIQSENLVFLSFILLLIPVIQRFILDSWFKWETRFSFTHVLGVLWFEWLGLHVLTDHFTNKEIRWKDRKL